MGNESSLQSYHIDYATIQNNIMAVKTKYFQIFRTENLLDDCQDTSGLTLISTKLIGSSTPRAVANPDQCYYECDQLPACVAVTICPGCDIGNVSNHCQIFSAVEIQSAVTDRMWKTTLFVNKMETVVRLQNTTVVVNRYSKTDIPTITSIDDCYPSCIEDAKCFAFTLSKVSESTIKCTRHTGSLLSLTQGTGVSVYFVSPLVKRLIRSQQTKGLVTSTMKNDWYDEVCVIDNECRQNNSMCFLNRCLCRPGFFFSPRDKTCSDTCSPADLQTTFVEYPESGIRGHNIVARDGVNLQTCKALCNSIRDCWSFDFRATGGRCLLHDIVSRDGFSYPQTSRGWTHYQRTCLQSPASYPGPVWYNALCNENADCPDPNSRCVSRKCLCNRGFVFLETDTKCHAAESCLDWKRNGGQSGVYFIQLPGKKEQLRVWCDMDTDNGGWLVFQRRRDGSVDFSRNWEEYEKGFGDITGEFWLGLSNLYTLTKDKPHTLRIDLGLANGQRSYANYAEFRVNGPETSYTLHASNYSGNAGDSLYRHHTMKFSTYDQDNDNSSHHHCARQFYGGWWFLSCHPANLNGRYGAGLWEGVIWNIKADFTFTEMKLKEV
ncbi:uncharacterized protein LOC112568306 [Pomacea canaliculata]|uniref:uncharacterized protein LOC112568306 n=1 Tax=Pomacea canaliculata TaxID=400727 RepID=UPI000D72C2BE|nr:uncharacterized protein LOC112568306 [Pomacea canaliculata]